MTTKQAAAAIGIDRTRLTRLATARNVGWRVGREWLFRPEDIEALRDRRPGRPRRGVT
jgi:hypothetical protein